jgi:hypothetical protein
MNVRPLDCAEIRAGFLAGAVPTGPTVENHLRRCSVCRELFEEGARLGRGLAGSVLPEAEAGALFALVERDLGAETGLRARLRALPTSARLLAVFSFASAIVVWHAVMRPRESLGGVYSPVALWFLLAVLLAAMFHGSRWLLRGVSSARSGRERTLALGLLGLPALVALVAPLGALHAHEALSAWESPAVCFSYGALSGFPLLVLFWLFERRDRMPLPALVTAGALSGVAANALLHCHCASANLPHLLLGHATIGIAWALVLAGASAATSKRRVGD